MMKLKSIALVFVLCISTACIHKPAGTTPITAWERVTTDNALLAQANNSLERGTEAVVSSQLLTPQQGQPVIAFTGQIATVHNQVTAILSKSVLVSGSPDATYLASLLAQIQSSGTALVNSGALGVTNPNTKQTIAQDIQLLVNLTQSLLSDAQAIEAGAQ